MHPILPFDQVCPLMLADSTGPAPSLSAMDDTVNFKTESSQREILQYCSFLWQIAGFETYLPKWHNMQSVQWVEWENGYN